ncbi:MAG: MarR family transcriptional regulator [Candidatus Brockarchaeota archaeon]|nr:MarR family transcriptional regulator [Candidatus Brockarchaeota archaeon]
MTLKRPSGVWLLLMLASGSALALKLLTPSVVQVVVTNDVVHVYMIPNVYTVGDVLTICLLSASFSYSTFRGVLGEKVLLAKGVGKDAIATLLRGDELKVYEMIKNSSPITQAELAKASGFSKAKLSGVLDVLEAYGLITRKRRGRENVLTLSTEQKA